MGLPHRERRGFVWAFESSAGHTHVEIVTRMINLVGRMHGGQAAVALATPSNLSRNHTALIFFFLGSCNTKECMLLPASVFITRAH